MSNVVSFKGDGLVGPGRRIEPDDVLEGAKGRLEQAVVFGFDKDGEIYVAGSEGPGDTMWLIEAAKLFLLQGARE